MCKPSERSCQHYSISIGDGSLQTLAIRVSLRGLPAWDLDLPRPVQIDMQSPQRKPRPESAQLAVTTAAKAMDMRVRTDWGRIFQRFWKGLFKRMIRLAGETRREGESSWLLGRAKSGAAQLNKRQALVEIATGGPRYYPWIWTVHRWLG